MVSNCRAIMFDKFETENFTRKRDHIDWCKECLFNAAKSMSNDDILIIEDSSIYDEIADVVFPRVVLFDDDGYIREGSNCIKNWKSMIPSFYKLGSRKEINIAKCQAIKNSLDLYKKNRWKTRKIILERNQNKDDGQFSSLAPLLWNDAEYVKYPESEIEEDNEEEFVLPSYTEKDFCIIDVETTGFAADAHIVEVACIRTDENASFAKDVFCKKIQPVGYFSEETKRIIGYSYKEWKNAVSGNLVFNEKSRLYEIMNGARIVGHNVDFDSKKIKSEFSYYGQKEPNFVDEICTLKIAKKLLPELRSHKLQSLREYFSLSNVSTHRALADACCTWELLKVLSYLPG